MRFVNYSMPVTAILVMGAWAPADAQFRCDCSEVVGSCTADVSVQPGWVEITTDQQQCARVDYLIDGQPFVSMVVEGEDRQDLVPRAEPPRVVVQTCQVCRDASPGAAAGTRAGESTARNNGAADSARDGALEALIEVPPEYPETAAARGLTGHVELDLTVGASGQVENASVRAADPAQVFDAAALAAVRRWRYPAEAGREPVTVTERIEFRPGMASASPAAGAPVARRPSTASLNRCLRQAAEFDYGETIEVGLLNACDTPVMVFGCAGGTGRDRGHWVCTTSEQQQNVLAPANDGRIDSTISVETDTGLMPLTFTDRFFMARAPNAEYWWLACSLDDLECRTAARLWARSVDKQVASVDPQGRSSLSVARSY